MARIPGQVAGVNHASGFTTNSNEDKFKRELWSVLVQIGWSEAAATAVLSVGFIEKQRWWMAQLAR